MRRWTIGPSVVVACALAAPLVLSCGDHGTDGEETGGETAVDRDVAAGTGADAGTGAGTSTTVEANATVDRIVDGDTIDVRVDGVDGVERVRLTGIDTPETKRPDTPVECFGPEATEFISSLLPAGTRVRLERDVVGRDDFGRLLAYVHRARDGLFVNVEIVRRGYAQPLTIPPNVTHSSLFVDAARAAEADDLGLWSACAG